MLIAELTEAVTTIPFLTTRSKSKAPMISVEGSWVFCLSVLMLQCAIVLGLQKYLFIQRVTLHYVLLRNMSLCMSNFAVRRSPRQRLSTRSAKPAT